MRGGAFKGDPQLKQFYLARLSAHLNAGQVVREVAVWDGRQGSPTGCTVHGDIALYESKLGIPGSLAWLHDWIYANEGHGAADALELNWLKAIEPGADLSRIEAYFVLWMLEDPTFGALARVRKAPEQVNASVIRVLEKVSTLYHQSLVEVVPHAQWKALREEAVNVTDQSIGRLDKTLASIAEAIAWAPGSALTATVDGMANWQAANYVAIGASVGWSDEWEARWDTVKAAADRVAHEQGAEGREAFFQIYSGLLEGDFELNERLQALQMALSIQESAREASKRLYLHQLLSTAPMCL